MCYLCVASPEPDRYDLKLELRRLKLEVVRLEGELVQAEKGYQELSLQHDRCY